MPESTKSPAEVLGAAADLLEKPGAWTQGAHARNAAGAPMLVGSRMDAVCWCVLGALDRMAPTNNLWDASVQAMNEVVGHVADFNDDPISWRPGPGWAFLTKTELDFIIAEENMRRAALSKATTQQEGR